MSIANELWFKWLTARRFVTYPRQQKVMAFNGMLEPLAMFQIETEDDDGHFWIKTPDEKQCWEYNSDEHLPLLEGTGEIAEFFNVIINDPGLHRNMPWGARLYAPSYTEMHTQAYSNARAFLDEQPVQDFDEPIPQEAIDTFMDVIQGEFFASWIANATLYVQAVNGKGETVGGLATEKPQEFIVLDKECNELWKCTSHSLLILTVTGLKSLIVKSHEKGLTKSIGNRIFTYLGPLKET